MLRSECFKHRLSLCGSQLKSMSTGPPADAWIRVIEQRCECWLSASPTQLTVDVRDQIGIPIPTAGRPA